MQEPAPIALHIRAGRLTIEVRCDVGPAAEARLGRQLRAAIRHGGTAVLVDLRHVGTPGPGVVGVLALARAPAEQRGMRFDFSLLLRLVGLVRVAACLCPPDRPRSSSFTAHGCDPPAGFHFNRL
ncbi:hypothetical protein GCM10010329_62230 [Streptomyces spiroverticillatus]|nr:hypothetical protein GCM10010329_62230 [Streptomyces spiroverticillatus]